MIIVLLPVYNEEGNIAKLLERFITIKHIGDFKIIIVNDGSQDSSQQIIESYISRLPIILINHDKNKGVTEAFKTGFREMLTFLESDDLVVTMDSDNTHNPDSIITILDKFNQGYDIINGSRYCEGGIIIGVPLYRRFLSDSCRFILTRLFPINNIRDYSVFYRGYRGSLIRQTFDFYGDNIFQTQGFAGVPELLVKLSRFNPRAIEIPLIVRYDNKIGASKLKLMRTIINYLYMCYILKCPHFSRKK